jgi:hypothetical protein
VALVKSRVRSAVAVQPLAIPPERLAEGSHVRTKSSEFNILLGQAELPVEHDDGTIFHAATRYRSAGIKRG